MEEHGTDEEIKMDVDEHLYWDERVDASKVAVIVTDGAVTLTGTVPTRAAVRAAFEDAWAVRGVRRVENHLMVAPPQEVDAPPDARIEENARSLLDWHPDFDASKISVRAGEGAITLTGTVDSFWRKRRVEELVGGLRGVVEIHNDLAVVPSHQIADEDIARAIVDALRRNALVDADEVTVSVAGGRVSLTGTVASPSAARAALETAYFTAGVRDVEDNLLMRG